jgi:hypothetical protein
MIEMDWSSILRQQRKPHIVSGRHCAPQRVLVDIADREILEKAAPPALFDWH